MIIDLQKENMTEISIEEGIIMTDLPEDSNKDMNLVEKSSEKKEVQFNGQKLTKLLQQMRDSILLPKYLYYYLGRFR